MRATRCATSTGTPGNPHLGAPDRSLHRPQSDRCIDASQRRRIRPPGIADRLETFPQRVAPFNAEVRHTEGPKNSAADAQSRIPQDAVAEAKEAEKEECTALPVTTRAQHRQQETWSNEAQQELKEEQQSDAEIKETATYPKKRAQMTKTERIPLTSWDANFDMVDGIVVRTKKNKTMPYIPRLKCNIQVPGAMTTTLV